MVLKYLSFTLLFALVLSCKPASKSCDECAETSEYTGQNLYLNQCASCHGNDGKLGNSGAKDLTQSKLSDVAIREILHEGKGAMPPMLELVAEPIHMDSVIHYIKTLRK